DPLDRPARQDWLGRSLALPVAHVEEAVLEAGTPQVGDEDLHRAGPPTNARTTAGSGRGMTWAARSSPIRAAASAPASTAARTLPTSPLTSAVTNPPPTWTRPARVTLAALSMASVASITPTRPLVSIKPSASPFMLPLPPIR